MLFNLTSLSSEPIHSQISKQLLEKILTDDYYDGTELPSPRALASEQYVNVNSVERAYMTLVEEGLVEIKNGGRFFVPLFTAEKRQELRFKLLTENSPLNAIQTLSGQLISVFDLEKLKNILKNNLKQHLSAKDVFFIFQNDESSEFELMATEECKEKICVEKNNAFFKNIAQLKKPSLLNEISSKKGAGELQKVLDKKNVVVVFPLLRDEDFIGIIALTGKTDKSDYSTEELSLFAVLANQFVVAYSTAQFYAEAMDRRRMQEELNMAAQIQADLIPKALPADEMVQVNAYCKPSRTIGGDFYDYLPIDENSFGLVIADACGKGLPAAMLISQIQAMIKSEVNNKNSIEQIMENMNNQLVNFTPKNKFVTLFYGVYYKDKKEFIYAGAGHNHPIVVRKNGDVDFLKSGGPGLGFIKGAKYKTGQIQLEQEDLLLLYTDGVTESMNESRQEYGEEQFQQLLVENRNLHPKDIIEKVNEDLEKFNSEKQLQDDRTMVVMKCLE